MLPQLQSHSGTTNNQSNWGWRLRRRAGAAVMRELCCGYCLRKRPEHIHDPYSLQHTVYSLASGVKSMK